MTYLQFLGLFIAPLLLATILLAGRAVGAHDAERALWKTGFAVLGLLLLVALVWTTPWDSWIIRRGVWSYPAGRVTATLFQVPAEEYLFMAAQTAAVGLWTLFNLARAEPLPASAGPSRGAPSRSTLSRSTLSRRALSRHRAARVAPAAGWIVAAASGIVLMHHDAHGTYLGSMLLWFGPALALQNLAGADILRARRRLRARSVLPPMLYLVAVDRIAIAADVWQISAARTYRIRPLGLPVEEGAFFALTTLLVANSLILAVHPVVQRRIRLVWHWRSSREQVMT